MEKVWIVKVESNVDGEIFFDAIVCKTKERALIELHKIVECIRTDSYHFKGFDKTEDFEIEQDIDSFYINDPSDDYYVDIAIEEKVVLPESFVEVLSC